MLLLNRIVIWRNCERNCKWGPLLTKRHVRFRTVPLIKYEYPCFVVATHMTPEGKFLSVIFTWSKIKIYPGKNVDNYHFWKCTIFKNLWNFVHKKCGFEEQLLKVVMVVNGKGSAKLITSYLLYNRT